MFSFQIKNDLDNAFHYCNLMLSNLSEIWSGKDLTVKSWLILKILVTNCKIDLKSEKKTKKLKDHKASKKCQTQSKPKSCDLKDIDYVVCTYTIFDDVKSFCNFYKCKILVWSIRKNNYLNSTIQLLAECPCRNPTFWIWQIGLIWSRKKNEKLISTSSQFIDSELEI